MIDNGKLLNFSENYSNKCSFPLFVFTDKDCSLSVKTNNFNNFKRTRKKAEKTVE